MPGTNKQLQRIVRDYQEAGEPWPADMGGIARWAIGTGRWASNPNSALRQCTRELSRALRAEYFTDANGQRVRAKHPVSKKGEDGGQMVLWDDIRTAPREHMEISFQQRRKRIVGDCRQLKTDADSYSDAHAEELPIQVEFDFTRDLHELELVAAASKRPRRRWSSSSSTALEPRVGRSPTADLETASQPSPSPH